MDAAFLAYMDRVRATPPRFLARAGTDLTEERRVQAIQAAGIDEINAVCCSVSRPGSDEPVPIFCRSVARGIAHPPYLIGGATIDSAIAIFDPARDGLNAEIGLGDTQKRPKKYVPIRCPDCGHDLFHAVAVLQYSEPPDEPTPEESARPQDFFTWLFLTGSCASCGAWCLFGDVECA